VSDNAKLVGSNSIRKREAGIKPGLKLPQNSKNVLLVSF
jgi:hypothetical protein